MGDLSEHFSSSEFECQGDDGCERLGPSCELIALLEAIRADAGGVPLRIVSGYRCERHNDAVGGAFDSRHLHGDAADIPYGYCTADAAWELGAVGIGTSGEWATHVDMRPGPRVTWSY